MRNHWNSISSGDIKRQNKDINGWLQIACHRARKASFCCVVPKQPKPKPFCPIPKNPYLLQQSLQIMPKRKSSIFISHEQVLMPFLFFFPTRAGGIAISDTGIGKRSLSNEGILEETSRFPREEREGIEESHRT